MKLQFTIEILKKGKWYLARTPELDFVSQGGTQEEAKKNLLEVIKIQIKEMRKMGTLKEYLGECGFEIKNNNITPKVKVVGFERSLVTL